MKAKILVPASCIILCVVAFLYYSKKQDQVAPKIPVPTNGETIVKEGSEDEDNQQKREKWFDLMHQAAPGTNWRALEYQTQMQRHIARKANQNQGSARNNEEILADGNLIGEWKERGSRNQSGSVFVTEFDPLTEEIYLISAGGTLWKGTLQGTDWQPLNQDFRFGEDLLRFITTNNGRRLIATIGEIPHYSDDDGLTWTASTGITINDRWGRSRRSVVIDNAENTIYLVSKPGYWDNFTLYKSSDNGETYTAIQQLNTNDLTHFALCNPHGSDQAYLIHRNNGFNTSVFRINQNTDELEPLVTNANFGLGNVNTNLAGFQEDTITTLLVYNSNKEVYTTTDFGNSWTLKGQMPTSPWDVGIFISPSNPDILLYGDIECYVSPNGGATWNKVNSWGDYYGDINHSLHADMMYFNEFQKSTGENFQLISNHGGLSVSYDYLNSKNNIGLIGLNVSQYYSVRTDPINTGFVYAGSQDQGFQRGFTFANLEIMAFDQVISGDYGHIVFSQNGSHLWTVYPGGWVTYYANPQSGGITASYELDSDNESVWIPPLMAKPNSPVNEIFVAGGNINGGSGSHIINLKVQGSNIITSQFPFDFYEESVEGVVSALKTSPLNPDHWYVGTSNGRFFYSTDNGQSWEQTINFVPEGHYLYGQTIYPSKFDENTVYFGGSGYSNPAVWKSTNGGETFNPMSDGLPPTLVFEITANQDESMFFAATEAGPYVYVVEEEQWYDMSGIAAPSQTYWSVEYVEAFDIVRFGTYGRGIWDFRISPPVSTKNILTRHKNLIAFPNPTNDLVQVELREMKNKKVDLTITDVYGSILKKEQLNLEQNQNLFYPLSLNKLARGVYIITAKDGDRIYSTKVILQ